MMSTELASRVFIAFMITSVTMYITLRSGRENALGWGLVFTFLFLHASHVLW
jgi:hypothetical protein